MLPVAGVTNEEWDWTIAPHNAAEVRVRVHVPVDGRINVKAAKPNARTRLFSTRCVVLTQPMVLPGTCGTKIVCGTNRHFSY